MLIVSAAATGNPTLPVTNDVRPTQDRQDTLQLREEELVAKKQNVETGQVQVGKNVVSEERTLDVPVTREEVVIERRPVDRRPSDTPINDHNSTIEVPVHEERVELEKKAVVYEEVAVGTRDVQETQQVTGTVKREEARIEREGDVNEPQVKPA